ncbi:unnamed protein product [Cylicocyclus nassatus]|uniref:EF-hand domain-containing protein n=1 Tax=Cylicocyclus nassatus TaxID=53992 RepID=A0AA36GWE4_CYLNA|nr:unnamed protein product [Cylicocyclus nassatus]
MRLLVLLALLEFAIGAPREKRQTPTELSNIPQALSNAPPGEHFLRHALFIPRGLEPQGFDPTKPIQGAYFIGGDQQFNIPPQFRIPQRQLPPSSSPQPLPVDPNLPPVDKSVDLDGDGRLSLPEVQYAAFVHHGLSSNVVKGMFNEVDSNKDGYLNSFEFNDIRAMVLAKAENAAMRYMQSVDTDKNKMLSLEEAQAYILREHGIGSRDVERVWKLVLPDTTAEMDAVQFSKLRRRIRGMTIRLARQIMKIADTNADGHISLDEAQAIAFEQEGIGAGDVAQMFASVDDNNDGELNAPEFADFERIVRARAVETSKKALRVVDTDASNTLTMDEAKRIAFEHYGFDENVLTPFFDQADENEDGHLDAVEFAGFRSVIRSKAVRNAVQVLKEIDTDNDGLISLAEAQEKTKREDDMEPHETVTLFNIADQNKSGKLDKVELADFIRLVRLSAIRFATDHFKEFDSNRDRLVTVDELAHLIEAKYHVPFDVTKEFFNKVDVDASGDLIPAEIVDFRHEIRKYVAQHPLPVSPEEEVTTSKQESPKQTNRRQLAKNIEDIVLTTTPAPPPPTTSTITTTTITTTATTTTTTQSTTPRSTTRRRTTRRQTTTTSEAPSTPAEIFTQTNGVDEFATDPLGLEAKPQLEVAFNDENEIDRPSTTKATRVWKPRNFSNTHSTVELTSTSTAVAETQFTHDPNVERTTTSRSIPTTAAEREFEPTTARPTKATKHRWTAPPTTTTEEPSTAIVFTTTELERNIASTTERTTTHKRHATARTRTTKSNPRVTTTVAPTSVPTEEFEYEIVEVEVDENGNEILSEKPESADTSAKVLGADETKEKGEKRSGRHQNASQKKPVTSETQILDEVSSKEERRRLVQEQKRALNLPPDTEVEYVDGDATKKPGDDYDDTEAESAEKEHQ